MCTGNELALGHGESKTNLPTVNAYDLRNASFRPAPPLNPACHKTLSIIEADGIERFIFIATQRHPGLRSNTCLVRPSRDHIVVDERQGVSPESTRRQTTA